MPTNANLLDLYANSLAPTPAARGMSPGTYLNSLGPPTHYATMHEFAQAVQPAPPALPPNFEARAMAATTAQEWFGLKHALIAAYPQKGAEYERLMTVLYSNPMQANSRAFDQATSAGRPGLLGRVGHAVSNAAGNTAGAVGRLATEAPGAVAGGAGNWLEHFLGTPEGRKQLAIIAATGAGSMALSGYFGAGGAVAGGGGAAAHGGLDVAGASVYGSGVDPFVAGSFGPIAGGGGGGLGAGLGAGTAAGATGAATAAGVHGGLDIAAGAGGMAGGMPWQELVLHGIPVLENYMGARDAAKNAQALQDAQRHQRNETLGFASPENYNALYEKYLGEYKDVYRPWLTTEADRAAIGEQTALQGFEADVARRGLSGSGLALAGASAIRTGRQAQLSENMLKYRQMWEDAARESATGTRNAQISASTGNPYTYVPRPSPAVGITTGLGDAYRDWLWLNTTKNSPFRSVKDQPVYG